MCSEETNFLLLHKEPTRSPGRHEADDGNTRRRSRSPPRRGLDYDDEGSDGRGIRDNRWENGREGRDGRDQVGDDADSYSRADVLRYLQEHGRFPSRRPRPHPRYERERTYVIPYDVPPVPQGPPPNTGEKDVSTTNAPSKYVLVRELKESTTEELFAKGLEKLYRGFDDTLGGAAPQALRRVLLIRDRQTDQSMGFGFAEYHSAEDAQEAVNKAKQMGDKLTISSKKFTIAFPHMGIFPHWDFGRHEYERKFLIEVTGSDKLHKYHDQRYYPSELVVNERPLFDADEGQRHAGDAEKKTKKKLQGTETLESKSKKRKAPGAVPAILGYYQRKQAEARGEQETEDTATQQPAAPATGVNAMAPTGAPPASSTADTGSSEEQPQTFAHEGEVIACYLCASQFNSKDGILRHLRESAMHAKYLADEKLIYRGYKRMEAKGIDKGSTIKLPPPVPESEPEKAEQVDGKGYRDRAAERRQEEASIGTVAGASGVGQQKVGFSLKPKPNKPSTSAGKYASPCSSDNEAAKKAAYGKGLGMLQKAGWSEGQGLGAGSGTGIAAPIEQSLYTAGVGLGHEGSKQGDAMEEAARMTRGDGFLEKTREQARRRWEQM